ncbi:MAG TPA: nucleoside triphosphate pyrophosphatase [Actinophytocola sp.]|uniref:Maf family protein n=1 Tax=Actinophytocola sp. TaxID=1872138 RepID=UPI002F939EB5
MQLVLASQSPARLQVLRGAGIEPVQYVSGVDEDALAASLPGPTPEQLVAALAEAKARTVAEAVAGQHPDSVIVGCDSMLAHDGVLVGKPGTPDRARERWMLMGGGAGVLLTGHTVLRIQNGVLGALASGTAQTTIRFGAPSPAEIDAYIATGEPMEVAGGFTLDGFGGWFVDGVDGDPSSVIGISLPLTRRLLLEVGVSVVDLWARR